jgi:hypothetical protein
LPPPEKFPEPSSPDRRQTGSATRRATWVHTVQGRNNSQERFVFRSALRFARPGALLLASLSLVACVSSAGATAPTPSPDPVDKDKPVFRLSWDGGFVSPEMLLGRMPIITIYADGRVITNGPVPAIYPGPLMPNLQEHTLSAEGLQRLIDLAREKDLLKTVHYDFPGIADAPDTVLEINLGGKTYRVSAYALAEAGVDLAAPGLDQDAIDGRADLRAFVDALTGVPAGDFVDEEHPFAFDGVRIYAGKAVVVPNSELPGEQPAIDWPLADLATAGEKVDNTVLDVRCQVVEGEDLAEVLPLLQEANALQTFRSEGELYSLIVIPLLPGETGC